MSNEDLRLALSPFTSLAKTTQEYVTLLLESAQAEAVCEAPQPNDRHRLSELLHTLEAVRHLLTTSSEELVDQHWNMSNMASIHEGFDYNN